jgi:tetratricopeptide (TPR) repeat protein
MKQEFKREEALRYLGISERTLRSWERQGLVEPADLYSFPQIVAMRAVVRLREARLPSRRIQAALSAVRRNLLSTDTPLTEFRLYSEGNRIRVQVGGQHMEPESGQLLLDFNQNEIERMVSIPARRAQEDRDRKLRDQQEAEKWFLRGVEVEAGGVRIEEAVDAYQKALELDPQLAAADVNLGTIYFTAQDWKKAEHHYRRAIENNPDYPLAHFNLANLHDERGEQEQALAHYQAALKLDPNYADAHYNLALLYQASGSSLKAVRHWRSYLKLDPGSSWATIARRELTKLSSAVLVSSPPPRLQR